MWYLPGPGWREGGGGRMGEGLLRRDASSALVTRQLCNSAEAEVGEAVRSPLFTHQPHPLLPNTQTLRAPRQMRTFSGELLVLYVASAEQAVRSWGCQSEKNREDSLLSPRGISSPRAPNPAPNPAPRGFLRKCFLLLAGGFPLEWFLLQHSVGAF